MRRLIVNGDDFGYTRGVNAGIVRAHRQGILTSTTLMANGEAFEDAVRLARECPSLGIGCHLVLVGGQAMAPVREIQSLAGPDGELPDTLGSLVKRLTLGRVKQEELETELRAQIQRIRMAGVQPTHVDTHKHTHLHPKVMRAVAQVAREFGIQAVRKPYENFRTLFGGSPGRRGEGQLGRSMTVAAARIGQARFKKLTGMRGLRTTDHFCGIRWTGTLAASHLLKLLTQLPEGTTELMCHPGMLDSELEKAGTRLKRERERELEALTDAEVLRAVRENGIQLISYRELGNCDA